MPDPSPKRDRLRWYQYRLRSLLILMLVVSLAMSWFAVKRKQAQEQKAAVEAIGTEGGVEYDHATYDADGNGIYGDPGYAPPWLRRWLGRDFFDTVVEACVYSPGAMEHLAKLSRLRTLSINCDEEPKAIESLKRLRGIGSLDELKLLGNGFTDESLQYLPELPRLRRLSFEDHPAIGIYDVLPQTSLKGRGLLHLAGCPALRELNLLNCKEFADEGLAAIECLPGLEKLCLGGTKVTSGGLRNLKNLASLKELDLSCCEGVDDSAAAYLRTMTGLKLLKLGGTKMRTSVAESLDDDLPGCRLTYDSHDALFPEQAGQGGGYF